MMSTELINHLQTSFTDLLRHENSEKLFCYSEEILDTLNFLCETEDKLSEVYFSNQMWIVDYITYRTAIHKFWNLNLISDTAFYMMHHNLNGSMDNFWGEYNKLRRN